MINKKVVFVIEDDTEIRNGYCFLIEYSQEFIAKGFSSAEDALKEILNYKPDLVLMDVNLPGMSGIECTMIIKKAYPEILIMMFTVYENNENVFKALEAGASGYILKQASPEELLDAIHQLNEGGAPMSSSIARMVVSSFSKVSNHEPDKFNLSEREKEVLDLLAGGFRYKDIADKLFISISTVRSHIFSMYEKLHVHNRTEALKKYKQK
ncbi:MAG: response regulator transcription factor [bacterium]